jgi:hypothetical protein
VALSTNSQESRSANLLHHLIRPARGGAIDVVIVFAVLLALGEKAGLMGIPAILISLSWYFKYGYILFDHVVRGLDEPPALDIAMLNPVDEQRPLWQLAILLMVVAGLRLVAETLPAAVWIILAVYPVALVRMISVLGLSYVVILAVLAGVALLIGLFAKLNGVATRKPCWTRTARFGSAPIRRRGPCSKTGSRRAVTRPKIIAGSSSG